MRGRILAPDAQRFLRGAVGDREQHRLLGGVVGILFAIWVVPALLSLAPAGLLPRTELVAVNGTVLLFAFAVSAATGIVFGLIPALQTTRPNRTLVEGARTFTTGQERLHGALVVILRRPDGRWM